MSENEYFTYSIYDINKIQKEKQEKRLNIYKTITSNCFKKIKLAVENDELYILYRIPEYIPGIPIFNMTECVMFILNELKDKGYSSRYVHPYMIFISWCINKPLLKSLPKKNNVLDSLKLKVKTTDNYKSIDNYKSSGKFFKL